MQNKNLVLYGKQFCVETKSLTLHKNKLMLHERVFHVNKKKLMLHIKNISCRQNQDNTAPKKLFCAQKSFFFPERCAFTQSQATWIDEHSRRRGFNNNKIIKYLSKETSKNIWGKLDIKLHFGNRKVIFTVFYAK